MPIDKDDALLILRKWCDEATPVRVSAHLFDGIFNFDCRIVLVSDGSVITQLAKKEDLCEFRITDFLFEYREAYTDIEKHQELAGHTYRAVIILKRPDEHIAFMEIVA